MPAKSEAQQRFFGMVRAVQEGKMAPGKVSKKLRETAMEISPKDAHDFAATKTDGLPEHVKKAALQVEGFIRRGLQQGLDTDRVESLCKVAFLPEVLAWTAPVLGSIGGGMGMRAGLGAIARGAETEGGLFNNAFGKRIAKIVPKAMEAIPKGGLISGKTTGGMTHDLLEQIGMTGGGIAGGALEQPIMNALKPQQPQDDTQYQYQ